MIKRLLPSLLLGIVVVLIAGLLPFEAFAQAVDLQGTTKKLAPQVAIFPRLVAIITYVIGAFFAVKALLALKGFIEKAEETPITHVLAYASASALLISLPHIITLTRQTFDMRDPTSVTSAAANMAGHQASDFACADQGTIGAVFCGIANQFSSFPGLMAVLCYVLAAILILMGLLNLKEYGDDPSRMAVRSIIIKFVLAVFLISLPAAMEIFMTTVTGDDQFKQSQAAPKRPRLFSGSIRGP